MNSSRRNFICSLLPFFFLTKSNIAKGQKISSSLAPKDGKYSDGIYPEQYGAVGDGKADDTNALVAAIDAAHSNGNGKVIFNRLYRITSTLHLPSDTIIQGLGKKTGLVFYEKVNKKTSVVSINAKNITIKNISILFSPSDWGHIGNISIIGILLDTLSSNCMLDNVYVKGKLSGTVGFTHCVRMTGKNNTLCNSFIEYGSMCVSMRGEKLIVLNNYISNHFFSEGVKPWKTNSHEWDGIVMEGCKDCQIVSNTVEGCGQSGIYCGGNNSVSTGTIIEKNKVFHNWNRGIDIGVSGKKNENNYVSNIIIRNNIVFDNREPQIWLFNVSDCEVLNNKVSISSNYDDIYHGYNGGRVGIALGNALETDNNKIMKNSISVEKKDLASITIYGKNNIIEDNTMQGKGYWIRGEIEKKLNVIQGNNLVN